MKSRACIRFVVRGSKPIGELLKSDTQLLAGINLLLFPSSGREIAPNTGANATKFFTLATKS